MQANKKVYREDKRKCETPAKLGKTCAKWGSNYCGLADGWCNGGPRA